MLTNREVATLEDAAQLIDWYRCRWEVELYFHIIKTGCQVEQLQLETMERVERALALALYPDGGMAYPLFDAARPGLS